MDLLLHICCAPCSVACVKTLREEGTEPVGFWYNPNIHPFLEYKARRDTLRQYARDIGLELREEDFYGLRQFTAAVAAGLYLQKYCGCVYSEEERFSNRRKKELHKLHKAEGRASQC